MSSQLHGARTKQWPRHTVDMSNRALGHNSCDAWIFDAVHVHN